MLLQRSNHKRSSLIPMRLTSLKAVLNCKIDIDGKTAIRGDISNLVQIIENLLINAVQSYEGMDNASNIVDLHILKEENMVKAVYSTIKGKFGGELWVESKENEGDRQGMIAQALGFYDENILAASRRTTQHTCLGDDRFDGVEGKNGC